MRVRIEYPFDATFEMSEVGSNSRELRTQFLQTYLMNSGMELGGEIESFEVTSFNGEDNGEFWRVEMIK
ncbi:MAG: hypothetical protein AB7F86_03975 [Bdellovibrionales bacterium]